MPATFRFAFPELAGLEPHDVADRVEHVALVRLELPPLAFQAIGGGQGDPLIAVNREAVRIDARLGKQLREA